jgi:hypothetical protein
MDLNMLCHTHLSKPLHGTIHCRTPPTPPLQQLVEHQALSHKDVQV